MDPEAVDWVELLRVHDRFQAEITVRFLEDHGVPVRTAGGATAALPMMGLTDVRILVKGEDLERAGQVLEAMRGPADVHPFRDAPPEPYEAPVARRKTPFATVMAVLAIAGVLFAGASAVISALTARRHPHPRPAPSEDMDPGPQIAVPQAH